MVNISPMAILGTAIALLLATPFMAPSDWLASGSEGVSPKGRNRDPALPDVPGVDAFPGAEGFGRRARGGRGGKIIAVTTLADQGPGSLRACIDAKGPRTCIFRVSGVIRFTTQRPVIHNPYITIAGQTAPGGGILITHAGGSQAYTPIVVSNTHDVIIRDIRVRTELNADPEHRGSNGSFLFKNSRDVIFDHVSGAWALDQVMTGYGDNDNITVSNSIFSEGIPRHDKCALLGSDPKGPQKLSFIRNICAHNGDRNPDVNFPPGSCVEIVNNVLYNGSSQFTEIHENFGGTPVNVVGNYYRRGPNSRTTIPAVDRVVIASKGKSRIFVADNQLDHVRVMTTAAAEEAMVPGPVCPLSTRAIPAEQAYVQALQQAGAFPRDSLDLRIVSEVRNRTGSIVRGPLLNGPRPLPVIAPGEPYVDLDEDGMADSWERANGMDPGRNDAWEDADRDKWLNLDEFLDFAHRQALAGRPIS
ncbi:pectate lyase family protein [Sphingobium bisphenolivorans]|uniref:pectate lyase family protein n=1 Tax=Sphingobium bisphenolivorans TaxID=1335760 RepID=UPI0003A83960|nr:pectate lyase [Sphingobium bisphenolivorans]